MPNHCENDLYIAGEPEKVEEFLAFAGLNDGEPQLDFNRFIPYPEKFAQMDAEFPGSGASEHELTKYREKYGTAMDGYNSGGYDWCCQNWGTKWNAYEVEKFEHPHRGLCITFQTAWTPPSPVIAAIAKRFPDLTLEHEYFEHGASYCGGVQYIHKDDCEDYDATPGEPYNAWQGSYSGSRGG